MTASSTILDDRARPRMVLSSGKLTELADRYRDEYQNAAPFPHIVIDDFLEPDALETVLSEFPAPKSIEWEGYDDAQQRKLGQKKEEGIGDYTRFLLYQFNSAPFVGFLEQLTGINGLLPDPHFWGGGLHQIEPSGFLKIHTDF